MDTKYFAIFITEHLYYLPQYLPIAEELKKRGKEFLFLLTGDDSKEQINIAKKYLNSVGYIFLDFPENPVKLTCKHMICGAHSFAKVPVSYDYSSFVVHGIGTKAGNFKPEQNKYDIRFVEGSFREKYLKELYPDLKTKLFNVGFAKLDPAVNMNDQEKLNFLERLKLDRSKKTILYAPTFYPSSIENMPKDFPNDFSDYNLIIKPHFFSFTNKTYKHQVRKFKKWAQYPNVYFAGVEEFNLTPFLAISDLLITDESSAIFEFAALDKPVICNRDVRYRWTYRIFKSKIKKRMEASLDQYRSIATNTFSYGELKQKTLIEINDPNLNHTNRAKMTEEVIGLADGKVSQRIVEILCQF
jgi:CDP-glycerol glycerophosphotransferase (TagB/SpsB family)